MPRSSGLRRAIAGAILGLGGVLTRDGCVCVDATGGRAISRGETDGRRAEQVAPDGGRTSIHDPIRKRAIPVVDATRKFREMADAAPAPEEEVRAFLRKRIALIRDSRHLDDAGKERRIGELEQLLDGSATGACPPEILPVPGGVGFGVFYRPGLLGFAQSARLYHTFVCPSTAGGDNADYLYLTATNRSAKGVEALILYYGQEAARFRVYDWRDRTRLGGKSSSRTPNSSPTWAS